jgi:DNA gyrase subunit A
MEDMIADEAVVITISHLGYIKRTLLTEYRTQSRGGRGSKGSTVRDEDFVEHIFVATNHNYIMLFSEKGQCYWLRAYEIPEGAKSTKGRAIQNLINIEAGDKIKAFINASNLKDEEYLNNNYIIMATKQGIIKKTLLEAYSRPRANGINAINITEGDELLEAKLTNGKNEIVLATESGRAIRFNESAVRAVGRNSIGVTGVRMADDKDVVIGMICIGDLEKETVLVVSENGYGKRTDIEDYRVTNRGGKGVKTMNITDKTGKLVSIKSVTEDNDLMIINKSGITIRIPVSALRVMGRATQGVRLIKLDDGDSIASVCKTDKDEIDEAIVNDSEAGTAIDIKGEALTGGIDAGSNGFDELKDDATENGAESKPTEPDAE